MTAIVGLVMLIVFFAAIVAIMADGCGWRDAIIIFLAAVAATAWVLVACYLVTR